MSGKAAASCSADNMLPVGALSQHVVLVLLLCVCVSNVRSLNEQVFGDIAAAEAQAGETAHRRSLQQNPDRPALNKYGGVNMTSEMLIRFDCLRL